MEQDMILYETPLLDELEEIILTAVFNFLEQGIRPLIKRGIVVLPAAYGYTDADSRSRVSGRPAPGLQ